MKRLLMALSLAVAAGSLSIVPLDADAKRLGGGRPAGMQRQLPPQQQTAPTPSPTQAPGQAVTPTPSPGMAGATAAAAGKRSWLGPVAGLAAGLGLAALFSHLGLGAGMGNFVTLLLLAVVAFVAIRWAMRRFAGGAARPAMAGAAPGATAAPMAFERAMPAPASEPTLPASNPTSSPVSSGNGVFGAAPQTAPAFAAPAGGPALPEGIDRDEFLRLAKMVFVRMQAANDEANADDLRRFTTPELFSSLLVDLNERGRSAQRTDVVQVDARIVDVVREPTRDVISVHYTGMLREAPGAGAESFSEVWHLVRPSGGGDWLIAGIQPLS